MEEKKQQLQKQYEAELKQAQQALMELQQRVAMITEQGLRVEGKLQALKDMAPEGDTGDDNGD